MRIGLFGDIHGNTVALDLALEAMALRAVDLLVCLGDLAANGPDPAGSIERVAELDCVVVAGNTDLDMLDPPAWWQDPAAVGAPASAVPAVEISHWCADQLGDDHRAYLRGLPATAEVDLQHGGRMLAFHGSPLAATDTITTTTPLDDMESWRGENRQEVLAGGHTHVPMVRRVGEQTMVNPGSVGLPFVDYGAVGEVPVARHAAYGLLTVNEDGTHFELCSVPVPSGDLAEQVDTSMMPHGNWWLGLRSLAG